SNNMSKLSQLKKIIIVFLAGFILLVNTACSNMNSPQASREDVNPRANVQKLTEDPDYDYYDANQPKQGGMNKYNDDPRLENSKLQKKVDNLVKGAKANVKKGNDNLAEYSDEVSKTGQVLGDIKEDVGQKIEGFKQDISQGTQKQLDKTKNNLEKASNDIRQNADDTSNTLKDDLNNRGKVTRTNTADTWNRINEPS
ncbi:MAG: hypothetical protein ACRC80_38415, partial [Waterburya sp.]